MGGFFGVVSREDCVNDVYFGTDYHSHLGTSMGGMAIWSGSSFNRAIHSIDNTQFRAKFESDLPKLNGKLGIGCISDTEPQPLTVRSRLGQYAISTVGKINNLDEIVDKLFANHHTHFLETNRGEIYPTELVSVIIDQENSFKDGLLKAQELIDGSCSILILTPRGIFASRDKMGRTPVMVGKKEGSYCVSFESCTFANLGYSFEYELGPGEIIFMTADGYETVSPPREKMKICAFLWVYYGYPSSTYEGMNVEVMRYRNGVAMAKKDDVEIDLVAGIPDSGIGHAIGYSNESKVPYGRPFIKYTPTWARSFMPQDQTIRNLVARMKLMPIPELVSGKRLLFCDDSIVRGTQLRETADLLYNCNAREVHIRSACPPLVFGCKYLNFSASRSEMDLVARQAIIKLEGREPESFDEYCDPSHDKYHCMVNCIKEILSFSTLKYQNLPDMLDSIGIDHEKICTYCWNGKG
ncbi:MAG TPA: amidophosphoribosyltransferase [Syntrophomonadaceae bacterium]|nr:amidophosphoribosyltransferase [Syntrophomonadaceae bacterium]HRX20642.1 amidophosphoribosyltransferase [Syntrophomonadaceae bacterium]